MKYSIIVPVYNVKEYIEDCIKSVLQQSYHNWELLLVDDGAVDGSAEICDLFAESDERIMVIHKANGGAADARNIGVGKASGDYILFLDADDYWDDEKALEKVNGRLNINNPDVLLTGRKKYFEKNGKVIKIDKILFSDSVKVSKEEFLKKAIEENAWKPAPCDKVVKRQLLIEKKISFEKGMLAEDILWTCKLMLHAETFDYLPECFYVYRQRQKSSSHQVNEKVVLAIYKQIEQELSMADGLTGQMREILYGFCAYDYAILLGFIFEMKKDIRESYYKKLKKWEFLLDYDICAKVHKVKKMRNIIGFRKLPGILNTYMKLKDRKV